MDELQQAVPEITELLRSTGHDLVSVTYGWGCNLSASELWSSEQIDTAQLGAFIQRAVQEGVFAFGQSDLHIEDPKGTLEFRLCHESDIHFGSDDAKLLTLVIRLWKEKGRTLYVSPVSRRSAARKEWKQI